MADKVESFNGQIWAEEFCRIAREKGHHLDKEWVEGWFRNALMRGYDEGARAVQQTQGAEKESPKPEAVDKKGKK